MSLLHFLFHQRGLNPGVLPRVSATWGPISPAAPQSSDSPEILSRPITDQRFTLNLFSYITSSSLWMIQHLQTDFKVSSEVKFKQKKMQKQKQVISLFL